VFELPTLYATNYITIATTERSFYELKLIKTNCCHTILNMKYCVPAFTCVQSLWPSYVQSIEISICVFSVCLFVTLVPEVYFSSPLRNKNIKNKPLEPGYLFVCMYVCKDVVIPGK
jgi:hypothetical protein